MSDNNVKYRHEYKYLCDSVQNAILKVRISGILSRDENSKADGSYIIRSLYFDDDKNSCYYENEDGVDNRDKYRIRIYNGNADRIVLEKKAKRRGMTRKVSCVIDRILCEKLMAGKRIELRNNMSLDLKEILTEINLKNLRPVVIVEYVRYPYVYRAGNVRITFDENIRSSNEIDKFLEKTIIARPILEKGKSILEVKWDEFLPDYITRCMQLDSLRWTSFSKYFLCRKYNMYGGLKL